MTGSNKVDVKNPPYLMQDPNDPGNLVNAPPLYPSQYSWRKDLTHHKDCTNPQRRKYKMQGPCAGAG